MPETTLASLRKQVDALNHEILTLLNQRAEHVQRISEIKTIQGMPLYDPQREEAQLADLLRMNRGPFSNQQVAAVFRAIFSASLELMEQEVRCGRPSKTSLRVTRQMFRLAGVTECLIE